MTDAADIDEGGGPSIMVGDEIGRGGEGVIREIVGCKDLVAKIYHAVPSRERQEKLLRMARMDVGALRELAAWPQDVVRDEDGKVRGFVMPRVADHCDVHFLYGPKSRREKFGDVDFRFVVRAASNVARAFAVAHGAGVVVGDVNFGGVTVSRRGTVKFLDCDSFQVADGGEVYLCGVATPQFSAPELAGCRLDGTVRTPNHDNFGLAVMIFHLLMMGRHPFAGKFLGRGDMPIEKAIAEFRYVYGSRAAAMMMAPPPGVPSVEQVAGSRIAEAFERAFGIEGEKEGRPDALRWAEMLDELHGMLRQCSGNPAHWIVGDECPWCAVEKASGVSMFGKAVEIAGGGLATLRDLALAVSAANAVSLPPAGMFSEPDEPSSVVVKHPKLMIFFKMMVIVGSYRLASETTWFWTTFILGWTCGMRLVNAVFQRHRLGYRARRAIEKERDEKLELRLGEIAMYEKMCGDQEREFASRRAALAAISECLKEIDFRRNQMRRNPREFQLAKYLRGFPIAGAEIPGVGEARRAALYNLGIRTAGDIYPGMSRNVPGVGRVLEDSMMAWRGRLAEGFVYDPSDDAMKQDLGGIESEAGEAWAYYESLVLEAKAERERRKEACMRQRRISTDEIVRLTGEISKLNAELGG